MSGYVGTRWLKINALPTPERLEHIVSLAPNIDASYSSINAPSATASELGKTYSDFLAGSQRLFMFDLASDAADLARLTCNDGFRQYLQSHTPLVHLALRDLYFYPPETLSTSCSGTPAFLQLSYPAAFSTAPHTHFQTSEGLSNRQLYDAICTEILRGSKPVKVVGPTREWRLPLRVDPEMRNWLATHPVLSSNGLRLS